MDTVMKEKDTAVETLTDQLLSAAYAAEEEKKAKKGKGDNK